jgi:uroporphyrin-3 C-methyltransferase
MHDTPQASAPPPAAPSAGDAMPQPRVSRPRGTGLALWFTLLALALFAWQWHENRGESGALRLDLARKLAEAETQTRAGRLAAEQARDAMAAAQAKLDALESRMAEAQDQQLALEILYQEFSRNRDEWAYAEIEQALFLASQQLQLAGNVNAALIVLQNVDARLQHMERAQVAALRQAIHRDIERMKASPRVDRVAVSARLDTLAARVDQLPLAMEARPQPAPSRGEARENDGNGWTRFWRDAWAELKQLVRVQQVKQPDAALLAPSQAFFLRENLRLRLVGARLALLSRDAASYRADLKAASDWLSRYFDTRHNAVAQAVAALRTLYEADAGIDAPALDATLEAMRKLQGSRGRGAR